MYSIKKVTSLFLWMVILLSALTSKAQTFNRVRDDFRDETIYFVMTTRFYDGDPNNNILSWDKQDMQTANNDPDWRGDFGRLYRPQHGK